MIRILRRGLKKARGSASPERFEAEFLDEREDLALLFCTKVLKLESLHWGYWEPRVTPTLGNLAEAQRRFSEELFRHIPSDVERVLDIGCGIGDNARLLAERGYNVTAISPDANQQMAMESLEAERVHFVRSGIETFQSTESFDLALMSESSHFFGMDVGFARCNELLRPGGYLLAASMVRRENTREFGNFHIARDWLQCARGHGYSVLDERDITEHVLPSSELIGKMYREYVLPMVDIGERLLARTPAHKRWILSFLVGGHLDKLHEYLTDGFISQVSDPELFAAKARYMVYLLQRS